MTGQTRKHLFYVNSFFLGVFTLFMGFSFLLAPLFGFYAVIPISIVILGLLPVFITKKLKYDVKEVFSLRGIRFKELALIFAGALAVLFLSQVIAAFAAKIYELFGKKSQPQIALETVPYKIAIQFVITCLIIPFFEEFFFRGFLSGMYQKLNIRFHAVISGILFGLFHVQFHVVIGTLFAGIIWAYFVRYSGSLIGGIIPHIIFNGTTLALLYLSKEFAATASGSHRTIETGALLMAAAIAALFALILIAVLKKLKSIYKEKHQAISEAYSNNETETNSIHTEIKYEDEPAEKVVLWSPVILFVVLIIFASTAVFFK